MDRDLMANEIEVSRIRLETSSLLLIASKIDSLASDISFRTNGKDPEIENLRDASDYIRSIANDLNKMKATEKTNPLLSK